MLPHMDYVLNRLKNSRITDIIIIQVQKNQQDHKNKIISKTLSKTAHNKILAQLKTLKKTITVVSFQKQPANLA